MCCIVTVALKGPEWARSSFRHSVQALAQTNPLVRFGFEPHAQSADGNSVQVEDLSNFVFVELRAPGEEPTRLTSSGGLNHDNAAAIAMRVFVSVNESCSTGHIADAIAAAEEQREHALELDK